MYPKSTAGVPTLFHRKKTCWHTKFCWDQWNGTFVVKILSWDFPNLNKQINLLIFVVVFLKWENLHTLAGKILPFSFFPSCFYLTYFFLETFDVLHCFVILNPGANQTEIFHIFNEDRKCTEKKN